MSMTEQAPGDATISPAFRLGWLLSRFASDRECLAARPINTAPTSSGPGLPGESQLPAHARAEHQLAAIVREHAGLVAAGISLSDASSLAAAVDDSTADETRRHAAIYELHLTWMRETATQSFLTSRAYNLGRALEETVRPPGSPEPLTDQVSEQFNRYRVSELSGWLDDLAGSFSANAAFAVKSALHSWTRWCEGSASRPKRRWWSFGREAPPPSDAELRGTLYRQGTIWFSLLGAQTEPRTFVIAENYADAAANLLHRSGKLARALGTGWWICIVVFAAVLICIVVLAEIYLTGSSQAATIVAAVIGAAGIAWKAVSATIGSTAKKLEDPLWEAEQRLAIAAAATRLPTNQTKSGRPPTNVP